MMLNRVLACSTERGEVDWIAPAKWRSMVSISLSKSAGMGVIARPAPANAPSALLGASSGPNCDSDSEVNSCSRPVLVAARFALVPGKVD